jgi:hypothetical protein
MMEGQLKTNSFNLSRFVTWQSTGGHLADASRMCESGPEPITKEESFTTARLPVMQSNTHKHDSEVVPFVIGKSKVLGESFISIYFADVKGLMI